MNNPPEYAKKILVQTTNPKDGWNVKAYACSACGRTLSAFCGDKCEHCGAKFIGRYMR